MSEEKFNQYDSTTLENYANTMLDKVSKNVVKYRKQKGFSQAQLAKAIGYKSAAYLGKAEVRKENHHFNIKQIAKISKVLEIDIDSFFK